MISPQHRRLNSQLPFQARSALWQRPHDCVPPTSCEATFGEGRGPDFSNKSKDMYVSLPVTATQQGCFFHMLTALLFCMRKWESSQEKGTSLNGKTLGFTCLWTCLAKICHSFCLRTTSVFHTDSCVSNI